MNIVFSHGKQGVLCWGAGHAAGQGRERNSGTQGWKQCAPPLSQARARCPTCKIQTTILGGSCLIFVYLTQFRKSYNSIDFKVNKSGKQGKEKLTV